MPDDAESPTYKAIRVLLMVPGLRGRLIRHAYARCHSVTDANDIVQDAIEKVLSGVTPWPRETCPELIDHLGSVINTVAWNKANSAAARREHPYVPEHAERIIDGAPNQEQALIEREDDDKARRRLGYHAEIVMQAERRGGGVAVAQEVAP